MESNVCRAEQLLVLVVMEQLVSIQFGVSRWAVFSLLA